MTRTRWVTVPLVHLVTLVNAERDYAVTIETVLMQQGAAIVRLDRKE